MSKIGIPKLQEHIPFQIVLGVVDTAVFSATGKHLSNIEILVLQGSWENRRYLQIAADNGYTQEYLKNDIGPQLWKRLSMALGEKVSKANLKAVLQQRIYQQEQENCRAKVGALVLPDAVASPLALTPSKPANYVELMNPNPQEGGVESNNSKTQQTSPGMGTLKPESRKFRKIAPTANSLVSVAQPKSQNPTIDRLTLSQQSYHTLPPRDYTRLVGRKTEVKKLLKWLSFEHPTPRIAVEGMGGIGKTTLLLEVAYRCLHASREARTGETSQDILPAFDAIVFTSAKPQHFTPCGILPRFRRECTLQDILISISRTLNCWDAPPANIEEACEQIYKHLAKSRVLLIVDNLETLAEQRDILGFLYELPSTVKVVITSREPTPFTSMRLTLYPKPRQLI